MSAFSAAPSTRSISGICERPRRSEKPRASTRSGWFLPRCLRTRRPTVSSHPAIAFAWSSSPSQDTPGLRAWDVELGRPGPSYSIDTVRALRAEVGPQGRIVFILGHDAFEEFHTWREPEAILSLCELVVMMRPPWPPARSPGDLCIAGGGAFRYDAGSGTIRHASGRGVSLLHITGLDISATAIRALVAAGRSIRFLVPPAVEAYIARHGLYRGEGRSA